MKLSVAETAVRKLEPEARETGDRQFRIRCPAGHYLGFTKMSRKPGGRDLSDQLQGLMCTQLGVPRSFWRDLAGCTKSRADYLALLDHAGCA